MNDGKGKEFMSQYFTGIAFVSFNQAEGSVQQQSATPRSPRDCYN